MALQATFTAVIVESWLWRAAAQHPGRDAVNGLSYEELWRSAAALAGTLEPGIRVGIAIEPGERFAIALHGVLLAGAIAVPHDLRLAGHERPRADLVIGDDDGWPWAPRGASPAAPAGHDLDAVALVVQTSGTSSDPREVELTYGNLLWSALGSAAALGVDPGERWLCAMPLSHVGGLSILLRSAIYGTSATVHPGFDGGRVLAELMRGGGPTLVSLVPTTLARLLDAGLRQSPELRTVLLGGAPIAPALLERAAEAGVPVTTTYGMTEACSQVVTAGRPLFCTHVELGADGEILIGGPTVAPASGPLLHSGDLGTFDTAGRLVVTGRKADTIISGGENIAPTEVEAVLESHPAVIEAAVLGRADPVWGEAVVAVVRVAAAVTDTALTEHCADRLARHKLPKQYLRVAGPLPRTASGKLQRRRIDLDELGAGD